MNTKGKISCLMLLFMCMVLAHKVYAQPCSVLTVPGYKSCFTEYFTSISASGDMGTTSTIAVSASSCTGMYFNLFGTQGISAPVGANVTLNFSRFTTHYTAYVSVYIDWDNNGQYEADEYAGAPSGPTIPKDVQMDPTVMSETCNITLECGISPAGTYRMRVMLSERRNNQGAPCDSGDYGQVYDFYYHTYCQPVTISGGTFLCTNDTGTLSTLSRCGDWTSSNPARVSVNDNGQIVSHAITGSAIITYTSDVCGTAYKIVSVGPTPPVAPSPICSGGNIVLAAWPLGGTWSSASSVISLSDIGGGMCDVTALGVGSSLVSYTYGGCSATLNLPTLSGVPVTGDTITCVGIPKIWSVTSLGGTWSSSNPSVAYTITSPSSLLLWMVADAAGTATITYHAPFGGCLGIKHVTVEAITPLPYANVCVGTSTTLTISPAGGTWNLDPGAVGMTLTPAGVYTGLFVATPFGYDATYTSIGGCQATTHLSIDDWRIYVPPVICIGGSAQAILVATGMHGAPAAGVSFTSSNPLVATVNTITGTVTGVSTGTAVITYIRPPLGCVSTATVVVGATPLTPPVTMCTGTTMEFYPDGDGTWTSSSSIVSVDLTTGTATAGSTVGSAYITFTPTDPTGCNIIHPISVSATPTVSGGTSVCQSYTVTLTGSPSGGTWSSLSSAASVSAAGVVTGVVPGLANIHYAVGGGCGLTYHVNVNGMPTITGPTSVCTTAGLTTSIPGGVWTSSNTSLATVSGGFVTSVGYGGVTISYTSPAGCLRMFPMTSLKPTLTTEDRYCARPMTPYSVGATPSGGVWSSSFPSLFHISGSGDVTIDNSVTGSIMLSYNFGGCTTNRTVEVVPSPTLTKRGGGTGTVFMSILANDDDYLPFTPSPTGIWGPIVGWNPGLGPGAFHSSSMPNFVTGELHLSVGHGSSGTGSGSAHAGETTIFYFVQLGGNFCKSNSMKVRVY